MATKTLTHSEFADGLVRLEFDWRDNDGTVLRFRCINNSDQPLFVEVVDVDPATGQEQTVWTGTAPAHATTTQPVAKLKFTWDTNDYDGDGVPDGGLDMGTYQIRARWPA